MALIQHDPNWLIELLEQNRSIHIHDGLGTFVNKVKYGWKILDRDDVLAILDQKLFSDLSFALSVAKSLKGRFSRQRNITSA